MFARSTPVASIAVLLWCCASQQNETVMPAPEVVEGELRLAGSEPATMVMLRPSSGEPEVRLHGEFIAELQRLTGVVVSVRGRMGASAMQGLEVQDYQIISVQGRQPTVGIVATRDGVFWLEGEAEVRLVDVPAGLRSQLGAKVWVLGTMIGESLRPETYGVIREPG